MSKLTLIEKALHSTDVANFQRLCDSYLKKLGHEHINPLGLVIGADKVAKGTPDTLIRRPDGKYDFAEYSTEQKGLASKFAADIAKCFDETKTGIPITRIHEIVLCHTARFDSRDEYALREQCLNRGVSLSVYGSGTIAQDLYQKYPGLASDFLGVDVDTGQIVTTDDFLALYHKRSFTTSLDTVFRFREQPLEQVAEMLSNKGVALISGRAGIGKTRFALECCKRYAKLHPDANVFCIFNKGTELFRDLQVRFREPGHFLILVDDANRLNHRFKYVLQLLHEQRSDQQIRVIVTVRDYALESVEKAAKPFGAEGTIELEQFNEEQIKELVRDNSAIRNPTYLERIAEIAKGNPRLAMMAAEVAERENNLQSIGDVSALYDEYFGSIRDELEDFNDSSLILVAGVIAFFRVVDRSNSEMMVTITDTFNIDGDAFWQSARRLHELEVVDIYENEIVKITDQVLSTYLFYLAAFKERVLDLGSLLELFPAFRYRLFDALNPVLNAFDFNAITQALRPHVDRRCDTAQQRDDEEALMHLLDAFSFVRPTDTLVYLREKIASMETQPVPLSSLTFAISNDLPPSPSILGILDNFRDGDRTEVNAALELTLEYLEKRPADLPLVLRMLQERYGMRYYSHFNDFLVERDMAQAVWSRTHDGKNAFFSRLFLAIAEPLLHTHFQTSQSTSRNVIKITNFNVTASKTLLDFRKQLWHRTLSLYSSLELQDDVLTLITKHSRSGYLVADREIIASDSVQILAFFKARLDPTIYRHCVVVHDYLDLLDRIGLKSNQVFRERFTGETHKLSKLLLVDRRERIEVGRQDYETKRRDRLAEYTASFKEADYSRFFQRCAEIVRTADGQQYEFQVQISVVKALLDLADRDHDLFINVLEGYLRSGNMLNLQPRMLSQKLIQLCGNERAYDILAVADYRARVSWLFAYFIALPENAVTYEHLQQLFALYESAEWHEMRLDLDHLLKFLPIEPEAVVKVTRTLLTRCGTEPKFGHALFGLFSEHTEVGHKLRKLFATEVGLLTQAYFAANEVEDHEDFDGRFFNELLNLDLNFGKHWVAHLYQKVDGPSRRDDSRDYSIIWRRHDANRVMEQIADAICAHGNNRLIHDAYLRNFFVLENGTADISVVHTRQDEFLDDVIERRSHDENLMMILFEVIAGFSGERRKPRFETFVQSNGDFELFQRLPIEPHFAVYNVGDLTRFHRRIEFLESLMPIFNTVELLRHRQHIDRLIQHERSSIEIEKRRDFMRDEY